MKTSPMKKNEIKFAFFGTSHIAVYVLDALEAANLVPALVITPEDKPQGRGLEVQSSEVAKWASARNIPLAHDWKEFETGTWDVAVVVDYGKILPQRILDIPVKGFLNVHPSLLPRLRGPSPMRSAILHDEKDTGVTIIKVDAKMDHGPMVAQKKVTIADWPPRLADFERTLLQEGGKLLAEMLPLWAAGEIEVREQNHDIATYSEKIQKEDAEINLSDDANQNLLKIRAFEGWPIAYTFFERPSTSAEQATKRIRVQILDAHIDGKKLVLDSVKPEGKKEMKYKEFLRSGAKPL